MRFAAVLLAVSTASRFINCAFGASPEFPYQAAVVVDEVLVRSGGGEKSFYPTQRLTRDAVVTVHRHDPGGWYVIEPPEGSFSWISAAHVDRGPDQQGTVSEDDSVVFVGSEFGDEASVWQRRLGRGDTVQILEERDLETLSGPRKMFRIVPPKREWRWIPGAAVVAVEAGQRQKLDQDPFDVPSSVRVRQELTDTSSPESVEAQTARPAPSERLARIQTIRGEQRRLAEIDRRFRDMLREPMSEWDLDDIEADYSNLQQSATHRPIAGHIDLRYPAIERYRERVAEFNDFKHLTTETERRDADLVAAQLGELPHMSAPLETAAAPSFAVKDYLPIPATDEAFLKQALADDAGADVSWEPEDGLVLPFSPTAADDPFFNQRSNSSYIGAGIVRKSPAGDFILTTPAGRLLAKLGETESVRLDEFVGRQVGLHGKRWYRQDLQSDFIEVIGLEPVRIRR